jgi:hypothetical protein
MTDGRSLISHSIFGASQSRSRPGSNTEARGPMWPWSHLNSSRRRNRVLISIRQTGRGRQSGVPIEYHYFQLFTIRDGKVRKVEFFRHPADALEAAGLSG